MSELSDFLPVLLDQKGDYVEPSVDLLSKKTRNALARLEVKRQTLQREGKIADGSRVGIIASGQNDWGRPAERESLEHGLAAERVARCLQSVGIVDVELVQGATLDDVLRLLRDPSISDMIYIGHAERSNLILEKTATWKSLAEEMTHLKHSVGVIGCSTSFKDTVSPRLGTLLVPDDGLLYGKAEGPARPSEMGDLVNFQPLDRQMSDFGNLDLSQYMPREQQAA